MSQKLWSPFEIRVMLHHYACRSPFEDNSSPVYPEIIRRLLAAGLIAESNDLCPYIATPLGEAFVAMLMSTPIPVTVYADPRFTHDKAPV